MKILLPFLLLGVLHATDDMPTWVIPGILAVESHSSIQSDGTIFYNDRKVGDAGELGCCQVTPDAFAAVKLPGESFSRCQKDTAFCVEIATRYLAWIYEHKANRDWLRTVGMYNAGFKTSRSAMNRRIAYLNKVRKKGTNQ